MGQTHSPCSQVGQNYADLLKSGEDAFRRRDRPRVLLAVDAIFDLFDHVRGRADFIAQSQYVTPHAPIARRRSSRRAHSAAPTQTRDFNSAAGDQTYLSFDADARILTSGERTCRLPPSEAIIFNLLVGGEGRVVSQDDISCALYKEGGIPDYELAIIRVLIFRLRGRLKSIHAQPLIANVRGKGYRWKHDRATVTAVGQRVVNPYAAWTHEEIQMLRRYVEDQRPMKNFAYDSERPLKSVLRQAKQLFPDRRPSQRLVVKTLRDIGFSAYEDKTNAGKLAVRRKGDTSATLYYPESLTEAVDIAINESLQSLRMIQAQYLSKIEVAQKLREATSKWEK